MEGSELEERGWAWWRVSREAASTHGAGARLSMAGGGGAHRLDGAQAQLQLLLGAVWGSTQGLDRRLQRKLRCEKLALRSAGRCRTLHWDDRCCRSQQGMFKGWKVEQGRRRGRPLKLAQPELNCSADVLLMWSGPGSRPMRDQLFREQWTAWRRRPPWPAGGRAGRRQPGVLKRPETLLAKSLYSSWPSYHHQLACRRRMSLRSIALATPVLPRPQRVQPVKQRARISSRRSAMADSSAQPAGTEAAAAKAPTPAQAVDFLTLLQHLKVRWIQERCAELAGAGSFTHAPHPQPSPAAAAPQTQKRTGWVKRGVAGPESIADHMYRMGAMALLAQGGQYDYHRCGAGLGDTTPRRQAGWQHMLPFAGQKKRHCASQLPRSASRQSPCFPANLPAPAPQLHQAGTGARRGRGHRGRHHPHMRRVRRGQARAGGAGGGADQGHAGGRHAGGCADGAGDGGQVAWLCCSLGGAEIWGS